MSLRNVFKKIINYSVSIIQKLVLNIALFLVYYLGFGITLIFIWVFDRKFFQRSDQKIDSVWRAAIDYDQSETELYRQS